MSKLTREDKIEIYERNENGVTIASLVKAFNVNKIVLHYLIRLIRKHGYDVLGNGKNRLYSKEFKLQTKGNLKLWLNLRKRLKEKKITQSMSKERK